MMPRIVALATLVPLAALACAGGSSSTLSGSDVLGRIPWTAPESATYRLLDGKDVVGTGVLTIEERGQQFVLGQSFQIPKEKIIDTVNVVVDSATLAPSSVQRRITGPEGERQCQASYAQGTVTVDQSSQEGQRTDRLNVPIKAYDTWGDLFLWRTLDFAAGFEVRYSDILTCSLAKPGVLSVAIKVTGRESVEVPAGKFEAWRLDIRSGGGTQKAWYSVEPPYILLRYDNGQLIFELEPSGA